MLPFDSLSHVYVPGLGCALETLHKKLTPLTLKSLISTHCLIPLTFTTAVGAPLKPTTQL